MATTISKLAVAVTARTDQFNKNMKKADSRLDRFRRSAGAASRAVGLMGAAAGGVAAVAMVKMTKDSLATMDATGKMADRLGIATEALTGMEHAARINGATAGDLHKGMYRMARTIGDVGDGSADAVRAFDKLGLTYDEIIGLEPDKQFALIADALKDVDNASTRMDLALTIFGRGGGSLLNLIMQGSSGIRALQEDAERLGLTFSRFEASKIESANDAMTRLGSATSALGNDMAIGLSPAIEAAADLLTDMVADNDIQDFFDRVGRSGAAAFNTIADAGHNARIAMKFLKIEALEAEQSLIKPAADSLVGGAAKIGGGALIGGSTAIQHFAGAIDDKEAERRYREAGVAFNDPNFGSAVDSLASPRNRNQSAIEQIRSEIAEIERIQDRLEREQDAQRNAIRGARGLPALDDGLDLSGTDALFKSIQRRYESMMEANKSPFDKWVEDMESLDKLFEKGLLSPEMLEKYRAAFTPDDFFNFPTFEQGETAPAVGSGRQVVLENFAASGIRSAASNTQKVESDQIEETNELLRELINSVPIGAGLG